VQGTGVESADVGQGEVMGADEADGTAFDQRTHYGPPVRRGVYRNLPKVTVSCG
jgi:hypothetical protein